MINNMKKEVYKHDIINEIMKIHNLFEEQSYSNEEYRANFISEICLKIEELFKNRLI